MPKDTDTYEAVHQALTDLVLPPLEALRAEIQRLNDRLDARPAPSIATSTGGLLSEQGRAYIDTLVHESTARTERAAAEWARRKATDPEERS